jgi:formate/nitrite transporter FocA (FNT family)
MFKKKERKSDRPSRIKGEALGASGFTLAILSIISAGGYLGVLFSMVGFVFCLIQQKNKPTKLGKAGLIISIIGFVGGILVMMFVTPLLVKYMETFPAS